MRRWRWWVAFWTCYKWGGVNHFFWTYGASLLRNMPTTFPSPLWCVVQLSFKSDTVSLHVWKKQLAVRTTSSIFSAMAVAYRRLTGRDCPRERNHAGNTKYSNERGFTNVCQSCISSVSLVSKLFGRYHIIRFVFSPLADYRSWAPRVQKPKDTTVYVGGSWYCFNAG